MPTRQDQLHSYQFMIQRVVAALVLRETDPPRPPFRRVAGATLAGVLVAALAVAAVAVYGVLAPGVGSGWRDGSAVIVERESGARYVYRDGRLHPVANYASALLIVGAPRTVLVGRKSLAGVPRGTRLGIADAPDSLPAASALVGAPWTVCSRDSTGSVLFVGSSPDGGRILADGALLGRHPDGSVYLIWRGRRHLVREPAVVLPALGWGSEPVAAVAPALLNALPVGADLARVVLPGRGQRSVRVPDAKVGDVFVVESQSGGRQYAVAQRDGLAGVTQVQADLLAGDPLTAGPVRSLTQGQYALIPRVADLVPVGELAPPASTPVLVWAGRGLCAAIRDADGIVEVRADVAVPPADDGVATGSRTGAGTVLVDLVVIPPGRGAVVAAAPGGTVSVVTDLGLRYPVAGPDVLAMLGFAGVRPVRLPAGVVALLPAGRALDPAAARSPFVG